MANATGIIQNINAYSLVCDSTMGHDMAHRIVRSGNIAGLSLPKLATHAYTSIVTIPTEYTIGTGLTLKLILTDDGTSSIDLGKVVVMGATAKKIANDETTDLSTGAATEQTANFTLSATSGGVVVSTIALANANLDSAGAGDSIFLKIRRVGTSASDTCPGRVILLGAYLYNTAT